MRRRPARVHGLGALAAGLGLLTALGPAAAPGVAQDAGGRPAGAAGMPRPSELTACPLPSSIATSQGNPFATVRYLADDALEGRLAGSPGEKCAAAFLADQFRRAGLEPAGEDGDWFQAVPLASQANPHAPGGTGRNVVGILRGSDPALTGEALVVGAHYDHLGRGPFGSLAPESQEIHNGADDNASGVAALLVAAERLAAARPPRSIVFVAFTGEELGLLGSTRYASEPSVPLERTVAMLNLDMVGRLGSERLIVYGMGTAEEWEGILAEANEPLGLSLALEASGYGPSDHTSFYSRDVPVLHFFTNVHGDYHRPSDDWEKIDFAGVERVGELVTRIAWELAGRGEPLTLIDSSGAPPAAASGEGHGAWLGTVPDFTPVERGVRISGVTEGSPAEAAGLRAGDVLVGLGDHEIGDLYDFTDALRSYRPGAEVAVRALRGDRELILEATLGSRDERPRDGG